MCFAINELVKERNENPTSKEYDELEDYAFTNEQIWNKCWLVMDGIDILGKSESFYSTEYGKVTHKKISGLIQSKFKAQPFKTSGGNSRRGWQRQSQNTIPDPLSEPNTDQLNDNGSVDQEDNDIARDTNDINSTNTNNDNDTNNNSNAAISANEFNNSYNIIEINSKDNSCSNLINSSPLPQTNQLVPSIQQSTQIKSYSKMPYRHLKCDACDASDATDATSRKTEINHKAKTKAEEVGLPEIPCLYCNFKDPIAFDLSLHYLEKHRQQLIRLPIGRSSIDDRADYAVELSKKKLFESLNEDETNDDDVKDEDEDDQ